MFRALALTLTAVATLLASSQAFAAGRSAKKIEADRNTLTAPEVIEKGDNVIGLRAAQGSTFENATVFGVNYEGMIRNNFGLGAQAHYAGYTVDYSVGGLKGSSDTNVWTFVGYGAFHVNMFKAKNLDTFFTAGVAHSRFNSKFKSNITLPAGFQMPEIEGTSSTAALAYFNVRYFIDSKFGFTVAAGTGLGTFQFGMDMLF